MTKANGELVSIDDSAYDGFKGMTVYGNTVQNLWVNPSGTSAGITVTSNNDGSMTVSGASTAEVAESILTGEVYALKRGTTYTLSVKSESTTLRFFAVRQYNDSDKIIRDTLIGGTQAPDTSATFTIKDTCAYARFIVGIPMSGTTASGTYRVMLNEGSTAEPWCPPGLNSVGDGGSVEVVTAGKNLLDFSKFNPAYYGVSGDGLKIVKPDEQAWTNIQPMLQLPPGDYTFRCAGVSNFQISTRDVGDMDWGPTTSSSSLHLSAPSEIAVKMFADVGTTVYPQLELGSTATGYEPPNITTTPIDLQGHTLNALPDGTRDELHIDGGGNVVLEKRTYVLDFDGTEYWRLYSGSSRANLTINDITMAYGGTEHSETNAFSDKLPALTPAQTWFNNNGFSVEPHNFAAFRSGMTGIDGFKSWLQTNNMNAVVGLATPQTIDLGTIDLPKLRKKPLVNNIWANGASEGTGFSLAPEIDYEYNRWSTYCDGFKTHGKHSYFDMGCCIAARDTGTPEKKSVTATVPYMSGFYDLSKLYGAIAFEARQLTYRFEFVEDSREELQQKKSQFLEWLSQVHDEEIADDDIPGRHFIGSLSEWEFEEGEEGQSGSLEVTFNCQPFLEADEDTTKTCNAGSNTVTVEGQAVNAYAKTSSGTSTIQIGGVTQSVGTTEIRLSVQLQPGDNAVTVTGSPVVLRWKELTV